MGAALRQGSRKKSTKGKLHIVRYNFQNIYLSLVRMGCEIFLQRLLWNQLVPNTSLGSAPAARSAV